MNAYRTIEYAARIGWKKGQIGTGLFSECTFPMRLSWKKYLCNDARIHNAPEKMKSGFWLLERFLNFPFSKVAITLIFAMISNGIAEASVRFNGRNDAIVLKEFTTEGMSAVTVMMWAKGEYAVGNLVRGSIIIHFSCGPGFYLLSQDRKESGYLDWGKEIADSKRWRHLSAVWSAPSNGDGMMKLYSNGIKQKKDLLYGGGASGTLGDRRLIIAGAFNCNIGPFKGQIEDLRIFNRALSDDEIFAVYAGNKSEELLKGLVLWYPMKNISAELRRDNKRCMILDQSMNGNHGGIMGDPVWLGAVEGVDAQMRQDQIIAAQKWLDVKRRDDEEVRILLANWFEKHFDGSEKWRKRFEELNQGRGVSKMHAATWSLDRLRGYRELYGEIGLKELFDDLDFCGRRVEMEGK
ncbi:MAG: hypothetical protein PHV34_01690 [Verrucomicrobiae bacterium]|nr:hypothetical protein [Verrucomicrobiae bacterium]